MRLPWGRGKNGQGSNDDNMVNQRTKEITSTHKEIKVESSLPVMLDGMAPRRLALPSNHLDKKQTEELLEKEAEVAISHSDFTENTDNVGKPSSPLSVPLTESEAKEIDQFESK